QSATAASRHSGVDMQQAPPHNMWPLQEMQERKKIKKKERKKKKKPESEATLTPTPSLML
ncbi:MAG: hypothetical protein FRX48_03746, partial [Lasallia pustulata]